MSSPTGSSQWLANPGLPFYNEVGTRSVRFESDDSAFLSFTPDSAGNRKTMTFSAWVKRGKLGEMRFFGADSDNYISFSSTNGLEMNLRNGGSGSNVVWHSNAKFRDFSAWYNVIFAIDTTQATDTNRVKVYVNGTQLTSFAEAAYPGQNNDMNSFNNAEAQLLGKFGSNSHFSGYMSEANFIDGLALAPSSFGETKNGIWIPIDTSGLTFGTNGFRIQFDQVGVGTASTTTIGADISGNTNHFTSSGLVASDCNMPDNPENNFATGNPNIPIPSGNLREGNLDYLRGSETSHGSAGATFTLPTTGKWYWEVMSGVSANNEAIGVANILDHNPQLPADGSEIGDRAGDYIYRSNAKKYSGGTAADYGVSFTGGDVIGVSWSSDDGTIAFSKNNAAQGTAYSSIVQAQGKYVPAVSNAETSSEIVFNFGADSSFVAHKTAQGNSDENGQGDFFYTPPSGFLALCSANLPEPTIGPNSKTQASDHFQTVLYTGTGASNAVTGVGFQPDWTWIKCRSRAGENRRHMLFDSNRGVGLDVHSDANAGDVSNSNTLTAFGSDGFTVGNDQQVNFDDDTYVSWNWHANGGTTSTLTDGSVNTTVQTNTTAGFSIMTYVSDQQNGTTLAHGLGVAPKWIVQKSRDEDNAFYQYHKEGLDDTKFTSWGAGSLSTGQPEATSTSWGDGSEDPTSTLFTTGDGSKSHDSGHKIFVYAFAEVEGYSKFGTYIGNGNAAGTFVFTGFRPAWIITKRINSTGNWYINDSVRSPKNPTSSFGANLYVGLNNAEGGNGMDILSNGFKLLNTDASQNANNGTYLYMAFAETPFKYSNAR